MELRAEDEARTRDLNLGKVALYQLSYFRIFDLRWALSDGMASDPKTHDKELYWEAKIRNTDLPEKFCCFTCIAGCKGYSPGSLPRVCLYSGANTNRNWRRQERRRRRILPGRKGRRKNVPSYMLYLLILGPGSLDVDP